MDPACLPPEGADLEPRPTLALQDPVTPPEQRLFAWVRERYLILLRRRAGLPRPWTLDPILQQYRFCNVKREDDRVTQWIAQEWRGPNAEDPDLWFAMCVARFINWPGTLQDLGYPVPWRPEHFLRVLGSRRALRQKVYSGAYMIRADPLNPGRPTAEYQARSIFQPLWENRQRLRPALGDTLNGYHMLLGQMFGFGSFMAAQVVADLKYVEPLRSASDWWTFAASGPGSRRGLNRVLGRTVNSAWTEDDWRLELGRLIERLEPQLLAAGLPRLHAQDFQNNLCELDKHERVRLGQGRPRAKYRGLL